MAVEDGEVVLGERRPRARRPWGRLPDGMQLGQISLLAVDSRNRAFPVERDAHEVSIWTRQGKRIGSLGEQPGRAVRRAVQSPGGTSPWRRTARSISATATAMPGCTGSRRQAS